ncbi:MAG: ArnT family glycosyltransferase [Candidatus Hodarchaeota archaeon]
MWFVKPSDFLYPYANNHPLNTLMIMFFTSFLGISEIILRIPALIGLIIYELSIYKISNLVFKRYFSLLSIIILVSNPFLIDYFSLARGYSLALGFLMLGIYYFLTTLESRNSIVKKNFLCLFFISISVLALLTFIYALLAILAIMVLLSMKKSFEEIARMGSNANENGFLSKIKVLFKTIFKDVFLPLIPCALLLLSLLTKFVLDLIRLERLYYGVDLFLSTLSSLTYYSFSWNDSVLNKILDATGTISSYLIIILAIFFVIKNVIIKQKRRVYKKDNPLLFTVLLLLFITGIIFFHHVVQPEILYLEGRTAFFYIPIFNLLIPILIHYLCPDKSNSVKNIEKKEPLHNGRRVNHITRKQDITTLSSRYFASFFSVILVFNGIISVNVNYFYSNKGSTGNDDIIRQLVYFYHENHAENETIDLYVHAPLGICFKYYKEKYGLERLNISRDVDYLDYEYYILIGYYHPIVQDDDQYILNNRNLTIIKYYPISDVYFASA